MRQAGLVLGDEAENTPALPMPFHMAKKSVKHWIDHEWSESETPNSVRFETFIFDVLPLSDQAIVVEASRDLEFAPVKNRDGNDSPETSRLALQMLWGDWLEAAGYSLERNADGSPSRTLEISPRIAIDKDQFIEAFDSFEIPDEGPILIQ